MTTTADPPPTRPPPESPSDQSPSAVSGMGGGAGQEPPSPGTRAGGRVRGRGGGSRRPTATSAFGVGRRESHDASDFYRRFAAPVVSDDETVCLPSSWRGVDTVLTGDLRTMPGALAPASVALVVTSPPYFSGKAYEAAVGEGSVPGDYHQYLAMLTGVLGACVEAMEPGARMAVNVANLGRKPYRSLSADVVRIMEEDLGLLLRGEVVWRKAKGAAGNCAWGSFQRPAGPVLRDLTERVVIASKGRFDRALAPWRRAAMGLPWESSLSRDEFMEATVDVWELPAERATRVGHPAPFPVTLPERLIHLYTYRGDLVLDPFIGSGTTAVAAVRAGRHFCGFDTDPDYAAAARARAAAERAALPARLGDATGDPGELATPDVVSGFGACARTLPSPLVAAAGQGLQAREIGRVTVEEAGFTAVTGPPRLPAGVTVDFAATDRAGRRWLFDVSGSFALGASGLRRPDEVWRAVGKAAVLRQLSPETPVVLLTTDAPAATSGPGRALAAACASGAVRDVVVLLEPAGLERLRRLWQTSVPDPAR